MRPLVGGTALALLALLLLPTAAACSRGEPVEGAYRQVDVVLIGPEGELARHRYINLDTEEVSGPHVVAHNGSVWVANNGMVQRLGADGTSPRWSTDTRDVLWSTPSSDGPLWLADGPRQVTIDGPAAVPVWFGSEAYSNPSRNACSFGIESPTITTHGGLTYAAGYVAAPVWGDSGRVRVTISSADGQTLLHERWFDADDTRAADNASEALHAWWPYRTDRLSEDGVPVLGIGTWGGPDRPDGLTAAYLALNSTGNHTFVDLQPDELWHAWDHTRGWLPADHRSWIEGDLVRDDRGQAFPLGGLTPTPHTYGTTDGLLVVTLWSHHDAHESEVGPHRVVPGVTGFAVLAIVVLAALVASSRADVGRAELTVRAVRTGRDHPDTSVRRTASDATAARCSAVRAGPPDAARRSIGTGRGGGLRSEPDRTR